MIYCVKAWGTLITKITTGTNAINTFVKELQCKTITILNYLLMIIT